MSPRVRRPGSHVTRFVKTLKPIVGNFTASIPLGWTGEAPSQESLDEDRGPHSRNSHPGERTRFVGLVGIGAYMRTLGERIGAHDLRRI
jgi:hypothetical protein